MGIKRTIRYLLAAVLFLLVFCLLSCAKNARVNDIMVMDDTSNVLVYARLQNLLREDTEKLIYAGVPVTCTFYVNFYQERSYWFDHRISHLVIRNAIKYDNIKKSIYVKTHLNEKKMETAEFKDVESAEAYLLDLNGVSVGEVRKLDKKGKYYVTIKAKIEKDEHSRFVRYILLFLPFMDTETTWYRKEFIWKD
jgi:hypothetical protein